MQPSFDDYLEHYGIPGMKWGVRRTPEELGYKDKMSQSTKKAVDDYNKLDEKAFKKRYGQSKKKFAKNVKKYTNPVTKQTPITSEAALNRTIYGERGANKIEKSRAEKGLTYKQAEKRQFVKAIGSGLALYAAASWIENPNNVAKLTMLGKATINTVRKSQAAKAGRKKVAALASQVVWDVASKKWVHI